MLFLFVSLITSFQECSPFHAKTNCYLSDSFETQAFAFEAKHPDEFIEIAR